MEASDYMCGGNPGFSYNPDSLLPTVKHGGGSVKVWAAISWNSLGLIVALHSRISSKDYMNILEDVCSFNGPGIFPDGDSSFQDDNAPNIPLMWLRIGVANVEWPCGVSICSASWSDMLVTVTLRRRV